VNPRLKTAGLSNGHVSLGERTRYEKRENGTGRGGDTSSRTGNGIQGLASAR
jgi:hypothetical protein